MGEKGSCGLSWAQFSTAKVPPWAWGSWPCCLAEGVGNQESSWRSGTWKGSLQSCPAQGPAQESFLPLQGGFFQAGGGGGGKAFPERVTTVLPPPWQPRKPSVTHSGAASLPFRWPG